ncbi:MAG: hypothetical protein H6R37_834 [Deltaproteobacteria bacterium]|nr:hypothetical protein [Deltaproteobacteria bacterium]
MPPCFRGRADLGERAHQVVGSRKQKTVSPEEQGSEPVGKGGAI